MDDRELHAHFEEMKEMIRNLPEEIITVIDDEDAEDLREENETDDERAKEKEGSAMERR